MHFYGRTLSSGALALCTFKAVLFHLLLWIYAFLWTYPFIWGSGSGALHFYGRTLSSGDLHFYGRTLSSGALVQPQLEASVATTATAATATATATATAAAATAAAATVTAATESTAATATAATVTAATATAPAGFWKTGSKALINPKRIAHAFNDFFVFDIYICRLWSLFVRSVASEL